MKIFRLSEVLERSENQFLRNLGWLGASEVFVRVTRLVTAVVLARVMDPLMFGVAALVLTINELLRVFNRNGIGAKIIQCDEQELDSVCNTAYRLNILFCGTLFIVQCLVAYPLSDFYDVPELVPMLQVISLTYLLMPLGMVQASLLQREQKLKTCAMIDGGQVGVDNVLTSVLALIGFGAWAIVLPKFLTSPIWVFSYRYSHPWRPKSGLFYFVSVREVFEFGRYYLGIEILKTARLNLDNMLIARLLGMEALGLYYFARNAGLGFSLTLINAVNSALYPNLCELKSDLVALKKRFTRNLIQIAMIVIPLISLQAALAFIYVPLVFGEQWSSAIPILTLLCLSALPRPLAEGASALLLATGRINIDFRWNVFLTMVFVSLVALSATVSLVAVAGTILFIYLISHPIYLAVIWKIVFNSQPTSHIEAVKYAN